MEEENEDVNNTLKMLPPDLPLSPGKYEVKKRLQHLQLNSESVALLEQVGHGINENFVARSQPLQNWWKF